MRARRPIRWRDVFVRWVFSASRVGFEGCRCWSDVGGVREMPMAKAKPLDADGAIESGGIGGGGMVRGGIRKAKWIKMSERVEAIKKQSVESNGSVTEGSKG